MFKLVALVRRKPGTTHAFFRDYYETHHVPLASKSLEGFAVDYRRNYVEQSFGYFGEGDGTSIQGYDCVTEVLLPSQAAVDGLLKRMSDPEMSAAIVADEENFVDRDAISIMICTHVPSDG